MRLGAIRKAEGDRLDYDILLADWMTEGDSITGAEAIVKGDNDTTPPLAIESVAIYGPEAIVKVWLSGGEANQSYEVEATITTNDGRILTACFGVRLTDC